MTGGYVSKTDLVAALVRELVISGGCSGGAARPAGPGAAVAGQPDPGPGGDA